jgi:hypothetical protein
MPGLKSQGKIKAIALEGLVLECFIAFFPKRGFAGQMIGVNEVENFVHPRFRS